jgi:glycerol-3-phosphate dehydrogenase
MNRIDLLKQLHNKSDELWDVIVIGGGATGAGVALDASSRGFKTILLEQDDFGKGTSSRSTKLVHGGVRYLAQGDLALVFEALKERGLLLKNAPHLTSNLQFIVPVYSFLEACKYLAGLKIYDLLSGKLSLGKSHFITRSAALKRMPNLKEKGLIGGVVYHDGQFDDARLLISLIQTVHKFGGLPLNYCVVKKLIKDPNGKICGVVALDRESGDEFNINGKVVINATGVFADQILKLDQSLMKRTIRPSQGIHLVLDAAFLPGKFALMIPKTDDGRVLFAIPWYGKLVLGTTDTPVNDITLEPKALEEEIRFILKTAASYLVSAPTQNDILTIFAGLRPLIASPGDPASTRELSRKHKISISPSGLVTVEGGKWTIYRRMAQDTIDRIMKKGMLESRTCRTHHIAVFGAGDNHDSMDRFSIYGMQSREINRLISENPDLGNTLHPDLPYAKAEIIWICRNEMAVRLEDVLARRTRALFLDARASREMANTVAEIMAGEMGKPPSWVEEQVQQYYVTVQNYL